VVVLVYKPVTIEVETNSDSLLETLTVASITGAKLSEVTATKAPLNISPKLCTDFGVRLKV
jgi:hypothetical protein